MRRDVIRRRALAIGLLLGGIGAALGAALSATGGGGGTTTPTNTAPKILHIVFPEGFTRAQMADRIGAVDEIAKATRGVTPVLTPAAYGAATASSDLPGQFAGDGKPRSLEGFLFPAEYDFFSDETAAHFVARQLTAFNQHWAKVDLGYARSKNLTRYDVLIIASMVEKEVVVPKERQLVAAVIYNRLHAHMPLGIDATIRYALGIPATQSLTVVDLGNPTPYNTRRYQGLPPTPICNPGLPSIQAAAHPANVDYLYFVRKPDKRHHFFTNSFAAFKAYAAAHGYTP